MSRHARAKSNSGFYHVMIRGIGKQIIFEEDDDRKTFLSFLKHSVQKWKIHLIAFCIMNNHVHLVLCDIDDTMSLFMNSVESSYASYFNNKYERVGPLFQGRFKSEPLEDERRLLAAYRYVLNNPLKAGICYAWEYK